MDYDAAVEAISELDQSQIFGSTMVVASADINSSVRSSIEAMFSMEQPTVNYMTLKPMP